MRNIFKSWPTILTAALILWLTLAPHPVGAVHVTLFPGADKVVHFLMFATLTAAALADTYRISSQLTKGRIGIIILSVSLFAFFDEWAQYAMSMGRTAEISDLIADITGALVACLLIPGILRKYWNKK